VAARKRRLRDATADPRIDAAQTPEDLAAIDPLVDATGAPSERGPSPREKLAR
jgi:hypothetical protein